MIVHKDFLLKDILFYKIGGTARIVLEAKSHQDIIEAFAANLSPEELNRPRNDGTTPVYIAAERGRTDIVRILAEKLPPEELNRPRNDGVTPVIVAAHNQAIDALLELAKHGASPYLNYRGIDAMSYALKGGCDTKKIVEIAQAYEDFKQDRESNKKNPLPTTKQVSAEKVAIDSKIDLEL